MYSVVLKFNCGRPWCRSCGERSHESRSRISMNAPVFHRLSCVTRYSGEFFSQGWPFHVDVTPMGVHRYGTIGKNRRSREVTLWSFNAAWIRLTNHRSCISYFDELARLPFALRVVRILFLLRENAGESRINIVPSWNHKESLFLLYFSFLPRFSSNFR